MIIIQYHLGHYVETVILIKVYIVHFVIALEILWVKHVGDAREIFVTSTLSSDEHILETI